MLIARKPSLVHLIALAAAALLLALLAIAAPAPAQEPAGSVAKLERKAKSALRIARRARKVGRKALGKANAALDTAQAAQADADSLTSRLDAAKVASATSPGTVTTGSETDYVDLGGPAVTATVPASGLAEVWATVTFGAPNDGLVTLFEDGQQVPLDQNGFCGSGTINDALLSATTDTGDPVTLSTPPTILGAGFGCGSPGSTPGSVLVETTPGTHTFDLRYADCGCDPADSTFSDRTLRVAGRE